mmetsp:Transcript_16869/g.52396  ORF Transcript_16869/g.52396 Transcript_16869/m.52396 type:complete len:233 (-) Transcript_16869:22-720(-)
MPESLTATLLMPARWVSEGWLRQSPVAPARFHSQRALSMPPDRILPSGVKAHDVTHSVWPQRLEKRVRSFVPLRWFQTVRPWSAPPATTRSPRTSMHSKLASLASMSRPSALAGPAAHDGASGIRTSRSVRASSGRPPCVAAVAAAAGSALLATGGARPKYSSLRAAMSSRIPCALAVVDVVPRGASAPAPAGATARVVGATPRPRPAPLPDARGMRSAERSITGTVARWDQ